MGKGFSGDQKPHAVVVPFPLQGHINPILHFAYKLVSDGFVVTFVHSEHNHSRIMEAKEKMKMKDGENGDNMRLMSISDALAPDESRSDVHKLLDSLPKTLVSSPQKLIHDINETEPHPITCAVFHMPCFLPSLLPLVSFATKRPPWSLPESCHLTDSLSLIAGTAAVDKMINVLPFMPPLRSTKLIWMFGSRDAIKKFLKKIVDVAKEIREESLYMNYFMLSI